MRAPRTGTMKRHERAEAIAAAREFDAAFEAFYYEEYPLDQVRPRYKRLMKAQVRMNALVLGYFLGTKKTSVHARLKRRAARRKAAEQGALVA